MAKAVKKKKAEPTKKKEKVLKGLDAAKIARAPERLTRHSHYSPDRTMAVVKETELQALEAEVRESREMALSLAKLIDSLIKDEMGIELEVASSAAFVENPAPLKKVSSRKKAAARG